MSEKKPIRLGIIGLGRAGWGMHTAELAGRADKFEVVAACDLLAERRQKAADRYGCKTYERAEDLIADPEVEMVDIATRSCDHFAHAAMALRTGKLVFLEKPITVNYDEASRLKAIAEQSAGSLYIRHNRRFEPGFNHIREIMASGILGEVYEIKLRRVSYSRRDDWQTIKEFGGGQLLNWGPHIIDHGLQLLDSPLRSVWSSLKCIAAVGDAEDHLKIILTGGNGRVVDLQISGGAAISEPEYIVLGTKGGLSSTGNTISLRYLDPEVKLAPRSANPGTPVDGFGTPEKLPWIEKQIEVKPSNGRRMDGIWDALYMTIREGIPFPIKLDEAVEVMKVVSLAKEGTEF